MHRESGGISTFGGDMGWLSLGGASGPGAEGRLCKSGRSFNDVSLMPATTSSNSACALESGTSDVRDSDFEMAEPLTDDASPFDNLNLCALLLM